MCFVFCNVFLLCNVILPPITTLYPAKYRLKDAIIGDIYTLEWIICSNHKYWSSECH